MSKSDKHKNNAINTPGKGKKTGKSQKRRLSSVRLPDSPGGRQNVDLPSSQATPTREVTHTESEVVPYDERLLERSRTQWQFGDWDSLVKLDRETLQHHPDRAKLALLAAAGHLQTDSGGPAKQFIRLAQDWGCSRKLMAQILAAGVHNSLGRAATICGQQARALQHFETAIAVGTPGAEPNLLANARVVEQYRQLGLLAGSTRIQDQGNRRLPQGIQSGGQLPGAEQKSDSFAVSGLSAIRINTEAIESIENFIPADDFVSAKYDVTKISRLDKVLILLSTPRSGSTLLSDILRSNEVCLPHEYFQPYQYMPILADRWSAIGKDNILDGRQYIQSLTRCRTFVGGWLGINLHESHLHIYERLRTFFPEVPFFFVHISRSDLIAQAISYQIARQTKKWSSNFRLEQAPEYDFDKITSLASQIQSQNFLIQKYCHSRGISCHTVVYEDLIASPARCLNELSLALGLPKSLVFRTDLKRQSDSINGEWKSLYMSDLARKYNPSRIGEIAFINP
ncbi:MAG: Stf0 family sulfotransferase [Candidatus Accumulibacter sp. UW20]|jgi:LPS sulfotransferase NodH